jgi:hypothetical protein
VLPHALKGEVVVPVLGCSRGPGRLQPGEGRPAEDYGQSREFGFFEIPTPAGAPKKKTEWVFWRVTRIEETG